MALPFRVTPSNAFINNFSGKNPRVFLTAETDDVSEFDQVTIRKWKEEGFEVSYIPYNAKNDSQYKKTLQELGKGMRIGEDFAIVAYGDAAAVALEIYIKPHPKLCALVAYYPSSIPDTRTTFPMSLRMVIHLAGDEVGVNKNSEVLGIQGKRTTRKRRLDPGLGAGGTLKLAYPAYTYEGVEPGFAEHDLDEYDKVAERVAWSRSLGVVRKGLRMDVDDALEMIREREIEYAYLRKNAEKTMRGFAEKAHVTNVPTMTGGVGHKDLERFYSDFFTSKNPESMAMRLVSRTIGVDHVVDEFFLTFKHTREMPWILPGIPPTSENVEVAMVSVVRVRAGKLESEHLYWDQASVLVQIGLLDPMLVPEKWKKQGVEELPIFGSEPARLVVNERSHEFNELIDDW